MSKRPQDDTYCYVNNKWEKSIKIPKSYSKWSVFEELHEKKLKNLKKILNKKNDKKKEDKIISIFHMQYLEKNNQDLDPYMFYINMINYMAKDILIIKMVAFIKVNFKTVKDVEMVYINVLMVINMKVNGTMIRLTVRVLTSIETVLGTLVNGAKTASMDMVSSFGLIRPNLKAITSLEKKKELAPSDGPMDVPT